MRQVVHIFAIHGLHVDLHINLSGAQFFSRCQNSFGTYFVLWSCGDFFHVQVDMRGYGPIMPTIIFFHFDIPVIDCYWVVQPLTGRNGSVYR